MQKSNYLIFLYTHNGLGNDSVYENQDFKIKVIYSSMKIFASNITHYMVCNFSFKNMTTVYCIYGRKACEFCKSGNIRECILALFILAGILYTYEIA